MEGLTENLEVKAEKQYQLAELGHDPEYINCKDRFLEGYSFLINKYRKEKQFFSSIQDLFERISNYPRPTVSQHLEYLSNHKDRWANGEIAEYIQRLLSNAHPLYGFLVSKSFDKNLLNDRFVINLSQRAKIKFEGGIKKIRQYLH